MGGVEEERRETNDFGFLISRSEVVELSTAIHMRDVVIGTPNTRSENTYQDKEVLSSATPKDKAGEGTREKKNSPSSSLNRT